MRPTRSLLRVLTGAAALALLAPLSPLGPLAAQTAQGATVSPDAGDAQVRLVVRTATRAAGRDIVDVVDGLARQGARPVGRLPRLNAVSLEVPSSRAAGLRALLLRRGDVTSVEVAHRRYLNEAPADPRFAEQKSYLEVVRAPAAWDRTHGAGDVRIAVVDSGVDVTHPDLAPKIAGAFNAVQPGTGVRDLVGHGTGVASVAAAATSNGEGIAGAGYDSSLLAVKVADRTGRIFTDDLAKGIVWAADSGADIINLSLGGPTSDGLEKAAVEYAQRRGALVVAAAGNEGTSTRQFPGALAGVLAVGATTANGTARAAFSSFGPWVDVAAPGRSILLATPGGGYERADGTSFSSPMVAGEAALLLASRPDRTADELRQAVTAGATDARFGFARGNVDFVASLDLLPPATTPTITAPAEGSASSGVTTVSATSTAPKVRLGLADLTTVVSTTGGVATATFATYGLDGPQTVTAADCSAIGQCAGTAATATTTVTNAGPTITSPADGSTQAGDTIAVSAAAPEGAAVRFRVEGSSLSATVTGPYAATVPLESLSNGSHTVSAVLCRRDATRCDLAHAARVSITVARLHPGITGLSTALLSPNGDGRNDTTTVRYRLESRQTVTLRVQDPSGRTFLRREVGAQSAGPHTVVWDGTANSGRAVPDGSYRVQVATSSGSQRGLASRPVTVDTRAPVLGKVTTSGTRVLPVRDGYLDRVALETTVNERARTLALEVRSSSGRLVRTVTRTGVGPKKAVAVVWNGRDHSGRIAPTGSYSARLVVTDPAGNRRVGAAKSLTVSGQRLVRRTGSRTVTARESLTETFFDECSLVFRHANGKRKGWIGYYASGTCDSGDAYAVADHQVRLPDAVRYGTVRISAHGGRGDPRFQDTARLVYHDARQNVSTAEFRLGSALDTYTGPTVSAAKHLIRKRLLRWSTYTTGVNWYDVDTYTVRFTYFVLS
jgi:flagellar hook assembly protein FlgD